MGSLEGMAQGLGIVGASIGVVWGVLLGAAYLCRVTARLRRWPSIAILSGCYLGLAAAALLGLGWTWQGGAGVTGMLLPYAVAVGMILAVQVEARP